MGRTSAILFLLLGACGRLGFDGMGGDGSDGSASRGFGMNPSSTTPAGDLEPVVCQSSSWTLAMPAIASLSVAATTTGLTAIWASTAGGNLHGVNIAVADDGTLGAAGTAATIETGSFTATAATYIDGKLVTAVVSSSRVLVDTVPLDLSSYTEIGNVDGNFVNKTPLMPAGADLISPTSCDAGLNVNPFDSFTYSGTTAFTATSAASTAIAGINVGSDAGVVWSAADGCHVENITSDATGSGTSASATCPFPRVASQANEVALTYEGADGIYTTRDPIMTLSSANATKLTPGTSPRIIWDGAHYWMSFITTTGDVEVGYVDANGILRATTVADMTPAHDAYELVLDGANVFVVSSSATGLTASQLCIPQE